LLAHPRRLFWLVLCIIFLAELAVMFALNWLHLNLPWGTLALINALALSLVVSGVLLWAIIGSSRGSTESRTVRARPGGAPGANGLHPWKTFVLVVAAVFFIDTAVMLLFEMRQDLTLDHGWQEAVSHGVVSTIPVAGVVWWLVVAPLNEAMQALRESEARYRALFERSRDAIMILEPPSWKFTSANTATLRMFGVKDEAEFTALGPWDVSPPLQADGRLSSEKGLEMIDIALREGSHFFDWTHTRLGDGSFPATVLLTRIVQGGRTFLEATVRDVSAEVEAREALARANAELAEKNRQLEAANRAKAEFLTAVTHELRTPLNVILGFADVLAARDAGELNARQAEYVREIRGGGEELLQVVNAILDMSSFDAEKLADEAELVDVAGVVREAVTAHSELARLRGIEIGIRAEPGAERAECNPRALRRSLDQLLSNAIKFNRDGGRVTVSLRRGENGAIEIAVADTGIGIAAKDIPRLFQPFVQLDASCARRYGGIGIGLALVSRLSEACGGEVRVESEPGKGSVFTLRLPPGKAPATQRQVA
jgi:PAS domain S-box-containing protein